MPARKQIWRSLSKWANRPVVSKREAENLHQRWIAESGIHPSSLHLVRGHWYVIYGAKSSRAILQFTEDYLADLQSRVTAETMRVTKYYLRTWGEFCAGQRIAKLSDLNRKHIEQFRDSLTVEPSSRRRHLQAIRAALNIAVDWDLIEYNPAQRVKMPVDRTTYEPRILSDREIRIVQTDWPTPVREWAMLGIWAGLRRRELVYIAWSDIDMGDSKIAVTAKPEFDFQPKGTRYRDGRPDQIPLVPWLGDALESYRNVVSGEKTPAPRFVFDSGSNAPLWHPDTWYKKVRRLAKSSGMHDLTPHVFRHTFCTKLALAGVNRSVMPTLARHLDPQTTDRYIHASFADARREIAKLKPV